MDRRGFLALLGAASAITIACRGSKAVAVPSAGESDATRAQAIAAWEPKRTWAFFVGILDFLDPDYGSFPTEGRRDAELAEALVARGVPRSQLVFLRDGEATLAAITRAFDEHLRKAAAGDFLWVYYAGHGDRGDDGEGYFIPHDVRGADLAASAWSMRALFDAIEAGFPGSSALLTADCCFSGGLGEEAKRRTSAKLAYATLASSRASESSTGNWTYTECLLAGVRGDARVDADGDRAVTLDELAAYTEAEMAFVEEQLAAFTFATRFPAPLSLAAAATKEAPRVGERLEVLSEGDWYRAHVVEVDGDRCRVRYVEDSSDEWVEPSRMRAWSPKNWPIGSAVDVEWKGRWYPARVLDGRLGVSLVHYDDYASSWDEWVGGGRVRARE